MIVADTNLIVYLLMNGPHTRASESVFNKDPEWAAPLLWRSEFRNVLILQIRNRKLTLPEAQGFALDAIEILADHEFEVDSAKVLELAVDKSLTAYDAEFLWLARELGVPLVTTDHEILKIAKREAMRPEDFAPSKND